MKHQTPVPSAIVQRVLRESRIKDIGKASIRESGRIVNTIEQLSGIRFVRMEMGVPGLPASPQGVEAEIEALRRGVAAVYPPIDGIPELKHETSRFLKNFLNISIDPSGCVPTVGSMQGGFTAFLMTSRCFAQRPKTLFLDPGFPVQKQQHQVLGIPFESFDLYQFRGERLAEKIEEYLQKGDIAAILYSNPNNPAWVCFTEHELQIIGALARRYDVLIIEDLAYLGMDFRQDYSRPGQPPFQPTVARYADNYLLMISASKIFSYAGERIGMLAVSDALFQRNFPDLKRYYTSENFGHALVYGALYALSAGTAHAPQHALAAMLKAANEGQLDFVGETREYGAKAAIMKKMFLDNGFQLVYDRDEDLPLADGFYFTIAYPGMSSGALLEELLYYGISAISLEITGSTRTEGLRACVSLPQRSQFPDLEYRLRKFREHHPIA